MLLIQIINGAPSGYPVTRENFVALNPTVSFPAALTPEVVSPYHFGVYRPTNAPIVAQYEVAVEKPPTLAADGVWEQAWMVVAMSDAEEAAADATEASKVRSNRDALLRDCDWVVARAYELGAPVPTDWATYRQALRDITAQAGFPYLVIWPSKP